MKAGGAWDQSCQSTQLESTRHRFSLKWKRSTWKIDESARRLPVLLWQLWARSSDPRTIIVLSALFFNVRAVYIFFSVIDTDADSYQYFLLLLIFMNIIPVNVIPVNVLFATVLLTIACTEFITQSSFDLIVFMSCDLPFLAEKKLMNSNLQNFFARLYIFN